jgi:hypothetical protein
MNRKASTASINSQILLILDAIRALRSNPEARAYVREAILRVRQLRGILEARALTCEWCGADYQGDKLTLCRVCQKTQAEQRLSMVQFLRRMDGLTPDMPTGREFVIDGVRIPEVR